MAETLLLRAGDEAAAAAAGDADRDLELNEPAVIWLDDGSPALVVGDDAGTNIDDLPRFTVDASGGAWFGGDDPLTLDLVESAVVVEMPSGAVNGLLVKVGGVSTGYGRGQPIVVVEEGAGDATQQSAAGSILFRVDEKGSVGSNGGAHFVAGLRKPYGGTQIIWTQPTEDVIHILGTRRAGAAQPFLRYADDAGTRLIEIDAGGALVFGGDTNLYRSAPNGLKTDDTFRVGDNIAAVPGSGQFAAIRVVLSGTGSANGAGTLLAIEQDVEPAAPGVNTAVLFVRDNGAGKTQWCAKFATGAVQVLATQP